MLGPKISSRAARISSGSSAEGTGLPDATSYDLVVLANGCGARRTAVEAFQTDTESLAWATAGVSVALAVAASAFLRYL